LIEFWEFIRIEQLVERLAVSAKKYGKKMEE